MRILKTKNYEMFQLRDDNRRIIDKEYIKSLVESIRTKNLLEVRPITVNANMEVIDGQHRLEACKQIGCDVYYIMDDELEGGDIIRLNISKSWKPEDFMNYYIQNGYSNYIEFARFMQKHKLSIRQLRDLMGLRADYDQFRQGKLIFDEKQVEGLTVICKETYKVFDEHNKSSSWMRTRRSTRALAVLTEHPLFDKNIWLKNVHFCVYRLTIKPTKAEYLKMFLEVYNFKLRSNKIELSVIEEKELAKRN